MICPYCGHNDDKVIDSRSSDGGRVIRRRRQCLKCSKRFTTYERVEQTARLIVVKRDGRREPFDRENILAGIHAACGKRPIPEPVRQKVVDEVEEELHREFEREVDSRTIGERVMTRLRAVDDVAYFRFASEYLDFKDVKDMKQELEAIATRVKDVREQQALF
ncbi:MAG: transcriptional regulator NrdR [Phycisphaerales bacterium]